MKNVNCILPMNRKPTWNEIELYSSHLDNEISSIQPQIIVLLGYYATHSILTKYHADPSSKEMSFKKYKRQITSTG